MSQIMLFLGESRSGILGSESRAVLSDRDHNDDRYNRIMIFHIECLCGGGMECNMVQ